MISNSNNAIYWSNPDSNFSNLGLNTNPVMPRYQQPAFPLVSSNTDIAMPNMGLGYNGFGFGGLPFGGFPFGGLPWGIGFF